MALALSAPELLDLLHISESSLPIGSQSHSWGLETLVADGVLTVNNLEAFLAAYVSECVTVDCVFCRAGYQTAQRPWGETAPDEWLAIQRRLAALRPARELRAASATLGRNFLTLVAEISQHATLATALRAAREQNAGCHHAPAFGLACGVLAIDEEVGVLAYAQQTVASLLAAAQKLLPIGQRTVAAIRWRLKPVFVQAATASRELDWRVAIPRSFTPMVEVAAMRHPSLPVRLFVS